MKRLAQFTASLFLVSGTLACSGERSGSSSDNASPDETSPDETSPDDASNSSTGGDTAQPPAEGTGGVVAVDPGDACSEGASRSAADGCNTCTCANGDWACTDKACVGDMRRRVVLALEIPARTPNTVPTKRANIAALQMRSRPASHVPRHARLSKIPFAVATARPTATLALQTRPAPACRPRGGAPQSKAGIASERTRSPSCAVLSVFVAFGCSDETPEQALGSGGNLHSGGAPQDREADEPETAQGGLDKR